MRPADGNIAAVVLAAGRSTRMGGANKLLLPWEGGAVVRTVVERLRQAGLAQIVVVVGHQAAQVRQALAPLALHWADNPRYAEGLSTSIQAGVRAVGESADGYLFALGDMPKVRAATLAGLCRALPDREGIAVPTMAGRRGNPVLVGAAYRAELLALEGDRGARPLVERHAGRVLEVEVDDEGIFIDVDTPAAYRDARS